MRAIGLTAFGGPDVLKTLDLPDPQPGPGEVRVRVRAATVNPSDTALRSGAFAQFMNDVQPPYIPGWDAAGEIDEVGEGVDWQVGDRVMAVVLPIGPNKGAYAERIVAPAESVARIPEGVGYPAASTLLMNGLTARMTLDQLALQPGQTLGVTGAAGSYGGYVVQLAKADGLRVVADAAPTDEPLVRQLGADVIVERGADVASRVREQVPEGVDGLADGAVLGADALPAVRDGGRLAQVRPFTGETERGITVHSVFVGDYLTRQDKIAQLQRLAADGALTLRVAETFPAEQAAETHRRLEAGGVRGRLVLEF
ncbi:NADPH:quinone reductase-like Zn-dependent oxidoreductase [Haloactinospora alba]|uniref:NADPH:quinone reductase-like Zn-dependent oxidoreductase n=1 Tax=Haloactinospora alba TaxID=405555 RepID=A0A543NAB8_9ACTN|nr:NADP-dependent oxidoreductase [Haloactinospora alba]TQN28755.1 NADPH:quinone reductase-like Zn-dependent oxidoreductase [Haloactinospora alba]